MKRNCLLYLYKASNVTRSCGQMIRNWYFRSMHLPLFCIKPRVHSTTNAFGWSVCDAKVTTGVIGIHFDNWITGIKMSVFYSSCCIWQIVEDSSRYVFCLMVFIIYKTCSSKIISNLQMLVVWRNYLPACVLRAPQQRFRSLCLSYKHGYVWMRFIFEMTIDVSAIRRCGFTKIFRHTEVRYDFLTLVSFADICFHNFGSFIDNDLENPRRNVYNHLNLIYLYDIVITQTVGP